MARASTGRRRGVGSRIGWPLKIFVGALLVVLILLILNAFALNNETKSASINVDGARLVNTTSGQLQVLDTGSPVKNGVIKAPEFAKEGLDPGTPRSMATMASLKKAADTPIVLIHGSAGAINWWDDLIPLLEPYHRVIAIDMLGYGGSEKPDSGYSIENQANLVAQVLGRLDVQEAILVGHSLGGKVVTSVAEQTPELVSGLVLIDTAPDNSFGGLSGGARATRTPILGQALWRVAPDSVIRKNVEQGFAPGFDVPDKYVEDVREMTYPAYKDSAVEGEQFTEQQSLPDRLAAVGKPLLVIFGEEDQIYDAREALSAYAAIPGADTLLIPDSGHSPQVEAPEKTAAAIESFAYGIARKSVEKTFSRQIAEQKARQTKKRARAAAKRKANQVRKKAGNRTGSRSQSASNRANQSKQEAGQGN
ncbi:MAG: alpha/beta hydrolase [Solirubrobacterales bacterium]|nr:alpha/beta hydrolase [Solirubrobacterales bacterium]